MARCQSAQSKIAKQVQHTHDQSSDLKQRLKELAYQQQGLADQLQQQSTRIGLLESHSQQDDVGGATGNASDCSEEAQAWRLAQEKAQSKLRKRQTQLESAIMQVNIPRL